MEEVYFPTLTLSHPRNSGETQSATLFLARYPVSSSYGPLFSPPALHPISGVPAF